MIGSEGHPQTPARGGAPPLDSPLGARGTPSITACQRDVSPMDSLLGARGTPSTVGVPLVGTHRPSVRTIPLAPFLKGRGE